MQREAPWQSEQRAGQETHSSGRIGEVIVQVRDGPALEFAGQHCSFGEVSKAERESLQAGRPMAQRQAENAQVVHRLRGKRYGVVAQQGHGAGGKQVPGLGMRRPIQVGGHFVGGWTADAERVDLHAARAKRFDLAPDEGMRRRRVAAHEVTDAHTRCSITY